MNAKKCDRCGVFYMPSAPTQEIFIPETVTAVMISKVADFCPKCTRALDKWLKMEGDSE